MLITQNELLLLLDEILKFVDVGLVIVKFMLHVSHLIMGVSLRILRGMALLVLVGSVVGLGRVGLDPFRHVPGLHVVIGSLA